MKEEEKTHIVVYRKTILGTRGGGYSDEADVGGRLLRLEDLLMEVFKDDLLVLRRRPGLILSDPRPLRRVVRLVVLALRRAEDWD